MPSTTPPKGRPTAGRRDRQLAMRRSRSRSSTKRFVWALLAVAMLAAILVLGSGTGGNGTGTTAGSAVLPMLWVRRRRLGPEPRW